MLLPAPMGLPEETSEPAAVAPAEPKPTPPAGRLGVLVAWLRRADFDDAVIVTSLLALCVLVKLLWLTHVDIYWDAAAKWHFARQLSFANDFSHATWSHHMARFGVNLPAHLVQVLFGDSGRAYFIMPVAMHTLQALFVYLLARHFAGRGAGLLAALFMTFFTGMTRNASQLLPDGMVGTAAAMAGYAFVRFHEATGKARLRWLVAVAIGCVWAYAIKESSVLILPGFGLAIWLSRGRWPGFKEALIFSGIVGGYALLETLGFRIFTDYAHRLAIVNEEHGFYPPITFWGLFDRFARLDAPWQMLFWMWLLSAIYDLGSPNKARRLLVLLPVGYVFFLTFLVRSIDPILQWMSFKPRYMSPAGPFFVVGVAVTAAEALRRGWQYWPWTRLRELPQLLGRHAAAATFGLCLVLGVWSYRSERASFARHPLVELRRDAAIMNDAFRRNLPMVEDSDTPRGLYTIYGVYLKAKYLAQQDVATGGILPDIKQGVRHSKHGKKYAYILRDASAYGKGEMEELVEKGCGIKMSTKKSRIRISTDEKLPERCRAPKGEPIPR